MGGGLAVTTSAQSRLAIMQSRLQDVNHVVKMKNPSLLLQISQRPAPSPPARSGGGGGGGGDRDMHISMSGGGRGGGGRKRDA